MKRASQPISWIPLALASTWMLLGLPTPSHADSYSQYLNACSLARLRTFLGDESFQQEATDISLAYSLYLQEQDKMGVNVVGQALGNGNYPTDLAPNGSMVTLSYLFVDTVNGLPVAGPAVASVMYEANYDPNNPTDYVTLGTSTDAATNFSLSFTVQPYEPEIQAIPYDSSGNPIVISGVDGQNVALGVVTLLNPVPEPSALALGILGSLGGLGFVWFGRRKHRRRVPSVLP